MSEYEIREMCNSIYEGGYWEPMIDLIQGKDKEIERLNKELETLKQPQVFIDTQDMEERYGEELYKEYLEKENKRLNNIINELEKWLRSEIKRIEELQNPAKSKVKPYGEEYNNYTLIIGAYDNVLDKLQELKGEDKK